MKEEDIALTEKRLDRLNLSIDHTISRVQQLEKEVRYLFERIKQAESIGKSVSIKPWI